MDIRIINAYGPQEDSSKEVILKFWQEFENEIINAKEDDCAVLIELDANAKLGSGIVKNDPHKMSDNGKLLCDILSRQNLIVANSLQACKGVITRHRKTVLNEEKSVLDYIIFCEKLFQYFENMIIDDERTHVLTKYVTTKGFKKKSESDHNVLYGEFSLRHYNLKPEKQREIFNFKNIECQKMFYEATN